MGTARGIAVVGVTCALAGAAGGDGPVPLSPPGRLAARAGAGAAAGDDPWAALRNPASLARSDAHRFAVGGLARLDILDRTGAVPTDERWRLSGLPAAALVVGWDRRRPARWETTLRGSLQAFFHLPQVSPDGRLEVPLAARPALVEVRARGSRASVRDLVLEAVAGPDAPPLALAIAAGGPVPEADWGTLAAVREFAAWPEGAARLVVRYRVEFAADTGPSDRCEVRVDVDGEERARESHVAPPAAPEDPETPARPRARPVRPAAGGGADPMAPVPPPADPLPKSGPEPRPPSQIGPTPEPPPAPTMSDTAALRRLESGTWRLSLAFAPAGLYESAVDAAGASSHYRAGWAMEVGALGLAHALTDDVAIGAALHAYGSIFHGVQLPVRVPDGLGGTQEGRLRLDGATTAGLGFGLGVTVDVLQGITVGLHYTSRSFTGSHRGRATLDGLTTPGGFADATSGRWDAAVRGLTLPQRLGAGVAFRPFGDRLLFVADATWWDWSDVANDLRFVLDEPSNAASAGAVGSTVTRVNLPLDWDDRFATALGTTWRATPWLLAHAGYAFGKGTCHCQPVQPLLSSVTRHHVSGGVTVRIGPVETTLAYTHGLRERVTLVSGPGTTGARLAIETHEVAISAGVAF